MAYHLEILETLGCTNEKLKIFGRAHYSYINQIFGDEAVRDLIRKTIGKHFKGMLAIKPGASNAFHHTFKPDGRKKEELCSYNAGYQNDKIDINDTLCQSYSLMNFFGIPFVKTPAKVATDPEKYSRQMEMIKMYRWFLSDEKFVARFLTEFVHSEFKRDKDAWIDIVNHSKPKQFLIIERYLETPGELIVNIHRVLNIWEAYGWMYFICKGVCIPI